MASAESQPVGAVTALKGEATVAHVNLPQPSPVHVKDGVFFQDRFETQERSGVRILLGGKAIVTVRELSSVTITEEPKRAIIDLGWGQLALRLVRNLAPSGETAEVHTPNAIAAVRGSLLVTEIVGTADNPQTNFKALEAHVPILISSRADPTRMIPLSPNQAISISGKDKRATLSPVRNMPQEEARRERQVAERFHHPWHPRERPGRPEGLAVAEGHGGAAERAPGPRPDAKARRGGRRAPLR